MENINHVLVAVVAAGGQTKLAEQLGVSQQAISAWLRRGWVPIRRAVEIERLYSVPRQKLIDPRLVNIITPVD